MNNIIRFWNQNRKGIIAGIAAIVFLIVIIQVLNEMARQRNQAQNENVIQLTEEEKKLPTESIIGGEKVSIEQTKDNVEIIEEFIEKCNNGDISGAYAMLTEGCKKQLFSTEENFKKGYYDIIFSSKRLTNIENFISNSNRYTYRVNFYDDILSTGNAENSTSYQDYITVDENLENGKISINSLIYTEDINKETEKEGITVTILSKQVYKENERYEITIKNSTDKRISIDSREKSKTVYLVGSDNVSYGSYISEIASTLLEIPSNSERTYEIRFNKIYSSGVKTRDIVFSDMVPDYEKYELKPNEEKERVKISVRI